MGSRLAALTMQPVLFMIDSSASAVSADGSIVVGASVDSTRRTEAFRWTSQTGMSGLGFLRDGDFRGAGGFQEIGSIVAGTNQRPSISEAFRWTAETGIVGLGDLRGGESRSDADALSTNGAVIVGQSDSALGQEAFRWTAETGKVGLGKILGRPRLSPGGPLSEAYAVSADGSVVVGIDCSEHGCFGSGNEAFRWTEANGMVGLGVLAGTESSAAIGVSADGSVIVGYSRRWGKVLAKHLSGIQSTACGVSATHCSQGLHRS